MGEGRERRKAEKDGERQGGGWKKKPTSNTGKSHTGFAWFLYYVGETLRMDGHRRPNHNVIPFPQSKR